MQNGQKGKCGFVLIRPIVSAVNPLLSLRLEVKGGKNRQNAGHCFDC